MIHTLVYLAVILALAWCWKQDRNWARSVRRDENDYRCELNRHGARRNG